MARIVNRPNLAVVLAGTPKQVVRLIPSPEDGLFSRFLFYGFLPDNPLSWKDVRPREDLPDLDEVMLEGAREVRCLWSTLEGRGEDNPLNVALQPHHWDQLNAKMETIKGILFTQFDYAGSSTAHRTGLHVFRIAMILAVWRAFEEGRDLALEKTVTVEDEEFEAALALALTYAKHASALMLAYPREESAPDMADDDAQLYRTLPEEFERAEGMKVATGLGVTDRSFDRRLSTWVKMGHLRRLRKGVYSKVDRQSPPETS